MKSKILVVGLGNPGAQYKDTRHNIGFMLIDLIADELEAGIAWKNENEAKVAISRSNSLLGHISGSSNGFHIILAKPTTFMNLSGKAVLSLKSKYKPEAIFVIHDELDMKYGATSLKFAGGNNGHNGLKSISNAIGNDYYKIRVGIGRPEEDSQSQQSVASYVLSKMPQQQIQGLDSIKTSILPMIFNACS